MLADDRQCSHLAAVLGLSGQVLGPHPEQVVTQLRGRLIEEDGPAVAQLLASLSYDPRNALIPTRNGYLTRPGALMRTFPMGSAVNVVALLPDGTHALSGSDDHTLRLWDLDVGELAYFTDDGSIAAIALAKNGARMVLGDSLIGLDIVVS